MTVPYRPGLPSVEDVRAHERRGGWWMSRFTGPGDKIAPQVRRLFVDRKGQIRASEDADEYGMTASTIAIERRPCSPEGDPMDWPGTPAAPPAVVEFQTKRAPVKDPAGVTLPARLRCLVCGQYVGDDTLLIPAGYLHFSCIDDMARVPRPGAPPAGPVLDREGLIALCGEWEERAQILSRTGRPVMAAGIRECAGRLRALLTGTTGTGGADKGEG